MSWLSSILVSFLTGALGLLFGGFIMNLCVSWYRVSSFEGKSGYAIVGVAFLGGIAGFFLGLVVTRVVAGGAEPSALKGFGYACGSVVAVALIALGFCRLGADLVPTLNGRDLELAIEVRCPKGFVLPAGADEHGYKPSAEIYLPRGRRLPTAELRLQEAVQADGHWIVPATLPLTTSSSGKFLSARFDKTTSLIFNLPLRSKPEDSDLQWSAWVDSGWDVGSPRPTEDEKFSARYRVLLIEPAPPESEPVDTEAEEFALLDPNDSLAYCLTFFGPDKTPERNNAVAEIFSTRQSELAELLASDDESLREKALLATQYIAAPSPELSQAVLDEGKAIADRIRHLTTDSDSDPERLQSLSALSSRFNHWKRAWWIVYQRAGLEGRPIYAEIHSLSLAYPRGTPMDQIELNARVILQEIDK